MILYTLRENLLGETSPNFITRFEERNETVINRLIRWSRQVPLAQSISFFHGYAVLPFYA